MTKQTTTLQQILNSQIRKKSERSTSETSETDKEPEQETLDTPENYQPIQIKVIGKYFTKDYKQNK